jgi:hypothetical protein
MIGVAGAKKKGLHAEACNPLILLLNSGAGEENRTPDLLITNELLYQLSYTGKESGL